MEDYFKLFWPSQNKWTVASIYECMIAVCQNLNHLDFFLPITSQHYNFSWSTVLWLAKRNVRVHGLFVIESSSGLSLFLPTFLYILGPVLYDLWHTLRVCFRMGPSRAITLLAAGVKTEPLDLWDRSPIFPYFGRNIGLNPSELDFWGLRTNFLPLT